MTLAEAIKLLEKCTGLTFTLNECNGQVESKIGDWRVSVSNLTDDLAAGPSEMKILCATLVHPGCEAEQGVSWKTGKRFAVYSVRAGLLSICDWLIGFQFSVMGPNKVCRNCKFNSRWEDDYDVGGEDGTGHRVGFRCNNPHTPVIHTVVERESNPDMHESGCYIHTFGCNLWEEVK